MVNPLINKITDLLAREIDCLRELTGQLEAEKEALLSGRHDQLLGINEQKLILGKKLADIQNQRRELMARLGPADADPPKLIDLGRHLPAEQRRPFRAAVRTVAAMAGRLARLNQANHDFVAEALDTVDHLIEVLSGRGRQGASYGAEGVMRTPTARPRMVTREV